MEEIISLKGGRGKGGGGRQTRIKSTLSNLPIYFMSIFAISRRIAMRLEKMQQDFLWGGESLTHKPHLVN